MDTLSIGDTTIGPGHKPFVIAEIGTNYRDDLELAAAMADVAADAGADAAKFQTHLASDEMVKTAMADLGFADLYDRIETYEMSVTKHRELRDRCQKQEMMFLSTPFSVEAVDTLEEVGVPAYKIGSGELTNYHLLKRVANTGKPMLISTGMVEWETIEEAVSFVREHTDKFALLYCVSEYPTAAEDFNLGVIDRMKEAFDVPVGFSDHSQGIKAAVTAMARGADFVEKHFTLDRRLPGGDQEVSIEPDKLTELTEYANLVHQTRGSEREIRSAEESIRGWAHHSVVTTESIPAGERFTTDNVTAKRPGIGISASRYFDLIGSTVTRSLEPDTILDDEDVDW
jgi:N-acetylneuraminate synthase/N,N'-diacetyllegionaminate synthase